MKKVLLPSIIVLAVSVYLGNKFQTPCYDSLNNKADSNPIASILVNKCNGDTWALVRTSLVGKDGKSTGEITYRWTPIYIESEEARLSNK